MRRPLALLTLIAIGGCNLILDIDEPRHRPICGDGAVTGYEGCDDGNTDPRDGCDASCAIEHGFTCTGEPSACASSCGDGVVASDEGCDDGNDEPGDGCDASCAIERGYGCSGEPSRCSVVCGDGVVSAGEACDDGNDEPGDGCSAKCAIEHGYTCSGEPSACVATCGDGLVAAGAEECDDGDDEPSDGCDASCTVENGYACDGEPSACASSCGDGLVAAGDEGCDDGNKMAGDGCDPSCQPEQGFTCSGQPSVCTIECGDGVLGLNEQCDDGNKTAGDGCDANCQLEPGFTCAGEPTHCDPVCGDGLVVAGEGCDDKNLVDGDGCSASCAIELGFSCSGEPSVCAGICGDGMLVAGEQCEDGNTVGGDCCSPTCQIEMGCEIEPNDTYAQADARAADPNQPVSFSGDGVVKGSIGVVGDPDVFALSLSPVTSVVRFETFDATGKDCAAGVDTRLWLYQGSPPLSFYNDDDSGIGACSAMVLNMSAGAYYLKVEDSGNNDVIPGYALEVKLYAFGANEVEPDDTSATARSVPPGSDVYMWGSHQTGSDVDYYVLSIPGPSKKSIRAEIIEGTSGETCESNGIASRLTLYTSVGGLLVDDNVGNGRGACSLIDGTGTSPLHPSAHLLDPGNYYLRVAASTTAVGAAAQFDYRLAITVR